MSDQSGQEITCSEVEYKRSKRANAGGREPFVTITEQDNRVVLACAL